MPEINKTHPTKFEKNQNSNSVNDSYYLDLSVSQLFFSACQCNDLHKTEKKLLKLQTLKFSKFQEAACSRYFVLFHDGNVLDKADQVKLSSGSSANLCLLLNFVNWLGSMKNIITIITKEIQQRSTKFNISFSTLYVCVLEHVL